MYKRYENSYIKIDEGNKRYLSETIYPLIFNSYSDVYVISRVGDRLDVLSYLFYNDVRLWWVIAQANQVGKGSFFVESGTQLRIPMDLPEIGNQLKLANKL